LKNKKLTFLAHSVDNVQQLLFQIAKKYLFQDSYFLTVCQTWRLIMAALRSRCGHYVFALWFLSFFSSPNLSGRRLDVYHTSTHDVALVRI